MSKYLSVEEKYQHIKGYTDISYSKKQLQSITKSQKQEISKYYKAIFGGVTRHKDGKVSITRGLFSGKNVTKFNIRNDNNKKTYVKHLKQKGFKNASLSKLKVLPRKNDERILFNRGKDKHIEIWKGYDFKKQRLDKRRGVITILHKFNASEIVKLAIKHDVDYNDYDCNIREQAWQVIKNQFPPEMNQDKKGRIFQMVNQSGTYGIPTPTLYGVFDIIWKILNDFEYDNEKKAKLNPVVNQFQETRRKRGKLQ